MMIDIDKKQAHLNRLIQSLSFNGLVDVPAINTIQLKYSINMNAQKCRHKQKTDKSYA